MEHLIYLAAAVISAYIYPILILLFWAIVIGLSWKHGIARHIALIGAWSQICLTIAQSYYPQFLQSAVYTILIVWALLVTLLNWFFSKLISKDNLVLLTLFYSCAILAFSYMLNIISVPKFYQLGVLMTAITYMTLPALAVINKKVFNNRFYISGLTVGLAFLVGNTLHLMIEWTALVFFFNKILYIIAFLLLLLGILGFALMYYKKVSFLSFVSTYVFGFIMGFYGYSIIMMLQKLFV